MRGAVSPSSDEKDSQGSLGFQMDEEELKEEKTKKSPLPETIEAEAQKGEIDIEIEKLLTEELGFTRIIELLMKFKGPMIGHNMIYDIAFIYR